MSVESQQQSLFAFEKPVPAPHFIGKRVLRNDKRKLVGYFGVDPDRGATYFTHASREENYWPKIEGYALNHAVFNYLRNRQARTVYIHETETGNVYEFFFRQYMDGPSYTYDETTQHGIGLSEAVRTWDYDECTIKTPYELQ